MTVHLNTNESAQSVRLHTNALADADRRLAELHRQMADACAERAAILDGRKQTEEACRTSHEAGSSSTTGATSSGSAPAKPRVESSDGDEMDRVDARRALPQVVPLRRREEG